MDAHNILRNLILLLALIHLSPATSSGDRRTTYIIQLQPPDHLINTLITDDLDIWYKSFLPPSTTNLDDDHHPHLLYTYHEALTGFAARLTAAELAAMQTNPSFLRAFPDKLRPLATTYTPSFLGLRPDTPLWNTSSLGSGVIVAVLDSGITPHHPSFSDSGVPPPPTKWKGACNFPNGGCNNKLIGAISLLPDKATAAPIDEIGHGTHTASTIAGNFVSSAGVFGQATGTASGVAPHAHLAAYQICHSRGCPQTAILAGMDRAIKDGADIISLSLGGTAVGFTHDIIATGAFSAARKGIPVICSAGNSGPTPGTVGNVAPWVLTVAASSTDRRIAVAVKLGDGREFVGESLSQPKNFTTSPLPLKYVDLDDNEDYPVYPYSYCGYASSRRAGVEGKVAVILSGGYACQEDAIKQAGAAALIAVNPQSTGYTTKVNAPGALLTSYTSFTDGYDIISYAKSAGNSTASIVLEGTIFGSSPSPAVASFSSRGPSGVSVGILKPDVSGPGLNILAAWPAAPDAASDGAASFNMVSGTSMSAPHLSGVVALIKSLNPTWSPAAIKSAIMTTSDYKDRNGHDLIKDEQHKKASFFAMGAGHVNPTKAADPGLVYDISDSGEYAAYLCGIGYSATDVRAVVRSGEIGCEEVVSEQNLNYPSILVYWKDSNSTSTVVERTVTNVGEGACSYNVRVDLPDGVSVKVTPETLRFSGRNERKRFTVTIVFSGDGGETVEGNLFWVSEKHVVRSPIVITSRVADR